MPRPADRARIEALVFTLINWLDAQDAPLADLEPDADSEDSHDAELSEPDEELVAQREQALAYRRAAAHHAAEVTSLAPRRGGPR